jgi:hypothetical protein
MLTDPRRRRALFLALLTTTLAACHSGGGDDDDEDDSGDNGGGGGLADDADASGLWLGTVNRMGGTQDPFAVIASPNGDFVGVVISATGTGRLLIGAGSVVGTTLNASGTIFPGAGGSMPNGQPVANATIPSAVVAEHVSIRGSYTGGGEVGIFTLNYDGAKTARGAALATLAGTYTTYPAATTAGAPNWTITIQSGGVATFATSTGCNGTGAFAVIDAATNVYSWTLDVGACATAPASVFRGLATLDDNPTMGSSNLLRMFGATLARDLPFGFVGSK